MRNAGLFGVGALATEMLGPLGPGYLNFNPAEAAAPSEPLRVFDPSIYPAGDNQFGRIDAGAVTTDKTDFSAYYSAALTQHREQGSQADRQDYTVAMETTPLPTDWFGAARLPSFSELTPDFWRLKGFGLGFDETIPLQFGLTGYLDSSLSGLFTLSADGMERAHLAAVPQEFVWHAIIHSLRAVFQKLYDVDLSKFGPGTNLAKYDASLRQEFAGIIPAAGYKPVRLFRWPGPVDLRTVTGNIVGDGDTCLSHRPAANRRDLQIPEIFLPIRYTEGLENRSLINDEADPRADTRSHVELLTLFDPNAANLETSYLFMVLSNDSPPDRLRPAENHALADNFAGQVRCRRARWYLCGPAKPAEKTPTPTQTQQPPATQEATQIVSEGGGNGGGGEGQEQQVKGNDPYGGGSVKENQKNRENKGDDSPQVPFTSGSGGQEANAPGEQTIVDPAAGEPTYQNEP